MPFFFPPDSPNLHMLMAVASPEQRKKYLEPYAAGVAKSALALAMALRTVEGDRSAAYFSGEFSSERLFERALIESPPLVPARAAKRPGAGEPSNTSPDDSRLDRH